MSVCVQALPSLHTVPSALAVGLHWPVTGSHVPASWHWSDATQTIGFEPVQVPDWQVSVCVQALPSLHTVPSALAGLPHWPVVGSHDPASWHLSYATPTIGVDPMHVRNGH